MAPYTITYGMMAGHTQAYEKLHEYASKVRDTEYNTTATHGKLAYDARLDKTIQALQNQVKEQQDALEQVIHRKAALPDVVIC